MRFYTSTNNSRGKTVNAGAHKMQVTHTRGWNLGVKIVASGDKEDHFHIEATGGSNHPDDIVFLGTVRKDKNGKITFDQKP